MTIKDIAREAGYGVTTVSRVLNGSPNVSEKARQEIMDVVSRNHFRLNNNAKLLKQRAALGVAVVVKGAQNMLFSSILERLQKLLEAAGRNLVISYLDESADEVAEAVRLSREFRTEGVMFLGGDLVHFREGFSQLTLPCVLITSSAQDLGFANLSSITTDDSFAAECAIEHLMSLGHRSIGVLGGNAAGSYPAIRRLHGCRRAFARHGVDFDEDRGLVTSKFSVSAGYEAMGRLLDSMPELTAVFAMSDVTAIGAIRAIRDRGLRVPEDISVMGFDGIALGGYLTPRLTTIVQDSERLAEGSVRLLLAALSGAPSTHQIVPFALSHGESAKKLALES